ncbi:hypothetical protein [Polaribacter sargassicola]|uniref:hypothetical protein n=1 Tax=Polaribacter sargassicola TaxID=2836891 RepID=UPI001F21DB83|nr:hypothetical protein [Polaribacter sp. DS7-9]MCG1036879.1 hypothetical protein [Polaribacter sp. DS7-9]
MFTFLELKNKILEKLSFKDAEELMTPETDIDMLFLLKFACREGLDIRNVDKEKFLAANSNDLIIKPLNAFAPAGNQFLDISLNHILKEGNNYTYRDFFDVFGPNYLMHSEILKGDLEWEIGDVLNVDFIDDHKKKRTIGDLLHHLNNNQKKKEKNHRNPWWRFWK